MTKITLIVTCTFGLEAVVKREVQDLGFSDPVVSDGKIEFAATVNDISKLNISLRAADRVLVKLGEFAAKDFDQLFEGTKVLPWEHWITPDGKITVIGKSVKSKLVSVRSCQSIVKKAVIERLQEKLRIKELPETGAEYTIQAALLKDVAVLTIDTSGSGLHKRGYRIGIGEAPLRENIAAALVLLSSYNKRKLLIDPLCGSGTIAIEAAMIARKMAPGLNRTFESEHWPSIDKKTWEQVRQNARQATLPTGPLKIFGYDSNRQRIADSCANAKKAGVEKDIVFECKDLNDLKISEPAGIVISNPPYGVHSGSHSDLPALYTSINKIFADQKGWALYILTADKRFPQYMKRAHPDKIRKLFNGTIETNYYQYYAQNYGIVEPQNKTKVQSEIPPQ